MELKQILVGGIGYFRRLIFTGISVVNNFQREFIDLGIHFSFHSPIES